jgi:hypothetical protein
VISRRSSLRVAFKTSLENVLGASERLRSSGVTPLFFHATETSQPTVIGWMRAAAVYFRDPEPHLLAMLRAQLVKPALYVVLRLRRIDCKFDRRVGENLANEALGTRDR